MRHTILAGSEAMKVGQPRNTRIGRDHPAFCRNNAGAFDAQDTDGNVSEESLCWSMTYCAPVLARFARMPRRNDCRSGLASGARPNATLTTGRKSC